MHCAISIYEKINLDRLESKYKLYTKNCGGYYEIIETTFY